MMVYIVASLLSIILSIFIQKVFSYEKHKVLKVFLSLLPLTAVAVFRYDVGWDYLKIYTLGFYYVGELNKIWFSEQGFMLIIKILYNLFHDPLSLFVFFGITISLFFSLCCKEYGKDTHMYIYIVMFVITRYYFMSLNIMRQSLAVMIILYALHYIREKNFIKYLFFILLAFEIHFTSIVYLPLYFLLSKRLTRKRDLLFFITIIPVSFIGLYYFTMNTKYLNYFNSMFGNDGSIVFSEFIISLIIILTRIIFVSKKAKNDVMETVFFNMTLISFVISILSFILPLGDRMVWYFSMPYIFYIPYLIKNIPKPENRVIIGIVIIVLLIVICLMQTVWKDSYSILPYQSIFD